MYHRFRGVNFEPEYIYQGRISICVIAVTVAVAQATAVAGMQAAAVHSAAF